MEMSGIPFGTTDWSQIEPTEHKGEKGRAYWRTRHWCVKGHKFTLRAGTSYQVADNAEPHRSYTELGARLFIVD